jgi:amino acid adenylation domain-containing protein
MQNSEIIEGYQLSPQQSSLWDSSRGGGAFACQTALLLEGALDSAALRRAAQLLADRHEILRTTFKRLPSMQLPLQVVAAGASLDWREEDFGDPGGRALLDAVDERMRAERAEAFDLERGPLWRCALLRLNETRHVWLLTLPSLCADARTLRVMRGELARLYADGAPRQEGEAEPGPMQYVHFSEWQRELLDDGNAANAFWRRPEYARRPPLTLPYETAPDGATHGPRPERLSVEVEAGLAARFEGEARRRGARPEAAWLAAWMTVLWRLTGESNCVVDFVCDGRKYEELRDGLGLFERVVPVRCHFDGELRFDEVLGRAEAAVELAAQWQEYAGGEEEEAPASGPPIVFEYAREEQPDPARSGGVEFSTLRDYACTAPFKLKLSCLAKGDALACELQYDAHRFTARTVGRLARYLTTLIEAACSAPHAPARDLRILPDGLRHELLYGLNDTNRDYGDPVSPHRLIEAQAARTPAAVAVVCRGLRLSYAELNERANRLAHHLMSLGVGAESRVGLLMERSTDVIVALLATLKAGAAYMPLDHTHPKERLGFLLRDAGVSALLFHERLRAQLPEYDGRLVGVDGLALDELSGSNPAGRDIPESAAYVIYTSGSTGTPKGVVVERRQLFNYIKGACERLDVEPGASYALAQPLTVDFGVTALFPALCTGGCLHVIPEELHTDAHELGNYFAAHGIDFLKIAPSHLTALLTASEPVRLLPRRRLVLGGEVAQLSLVEQVQKLVPGCSVYSHYGPTETTVGVLTCRAQTTARRDEGPDALPAGRPLPNTSVYLLDGRLDPVALGCVGELYVGGAGVARGYLNRPALTAERFVPDPFASEPGARLYRTGDMARHLPDARVEYLGRVDQQVKVRGFRVEPGEVEAALRLHPSVKSAAVTARADESGEKRLNAYVTLARRETTAGELRAFLRERLPEYMIPAAFVTLDAMPLTRSGKIDKLALPPPDSAGPDPEEPFAPPATLEEEVLANIWADVLSVERVGANDNFFALGGDSMRSIQVLIKARQRGLEVGNDQLFQHQTVRQLAAAIAGTRRDPLVRTQTRPFGLISEQDRANLPEGVEDAYPLARLQAGMIYHSEYSPDSAIYHDLHTYHLQFHFDREAMQTALDQVVGRHPVLRTSFDLTRYSQPLQLVHENISVPVAVEDLRHLPPSAQDEVIAAWVETEKRRRVDWRQPPLVRFQAHIRSEGTLQFSVSYHHALLDGWSSASMQTELFERYLTLMRAPEAVPPAGPLSITYRDFVALEQNALASDECRRYWEDKLSEAPFTRLPRLPRAEGRSQEPQARVRQVEIPPEVSEGLKRLARTSALPLKSVLLAVHLKVMGVIGGQDSILTGIVSNSRPEEADGDKLLGVFLNTVPFHLTLEDCSWSELARRTFEAERELLPFRRYPLAELQRRRGGEPLFEAVFNFMNFHVFENVAKFDAVRVLGYTGHNELNYPLTANFSLSPNSYGVELLIDYHSSELSERQLDEISGYYLRALASMAEAPDGPHAGSTLLSAGERRQLLADWNSTRADYGEPVALHRMFEAQADRTPDAVALVFEGGRLTYRQLDERANQLARHLRALGVGPELGVGIMLERSPELVTALLAVLKAGGAYIPLDPDYPQERLAFMLEDAGAPVLLTHSGQLGRTAAGPGRVVCVDAEAQAIGRHSAARLDSAADADNLAYVIYTSGSTGRPKGAMNTHAALYNRLRWMQEEYRLTADDCVLQKTPFSFDVSVWEFFWPLATGARLVLARPGGHRDGAYLVELIKRERVTTLHFVPPMLQVFLDEPGVETCASLRRVVCSGEALPRELQERFHARMGGVELHNLYGPTEAAVDVTAWKCEPGDGHAGVPIGRPIANTQIYLLDKNLGPAPVGVAGELYIGGVQLARGYHARPGLTAERFVPDPFASEPGARLYRTGDLARFLPAGEIEYLGRVDHQVKIRGFRIELGEIEAALRRHEAVKEAAVLAREDGAGGKRLVAYVVFEPGRETEAGALRDFLRGVLPDYMLPAAFVTLDELPVTVNGKVNRLALPEPEMSREVLKNEYVMPRTPAEQVVAGIWREVLRAEQIGVNDHFFEIGGDSLLATRMIVRLRETFRVELPMRGLYAEPTISSIVSSLAEAWETREVLEEVAQTVLELEGLSEEEVSALISEVSPG